MIEVTTSNMGNISISAADGEEIELFGFGNSPNWWEKHAGELKFDLYTIAWHDLESDIVIKMDSGYPPSAACHCLLRTCLRSVVFNSVPFLN